MTKHEANVIGCLNMTDQISNEAYKQIMISAQDENEVCDVLDEIRAEIEKAVWEDVIVSLDGTDEVRIQRIDPDDVFEIIDKYRAESEE